MSPAFRIPLKMGSTARRAMYFLLFMVAVHWTVIIGLVGWLVTLDVPISNQERFPLLVFVAFGVYLIQVCRDRWRTYHNPPFIQFNPDQVLLPRGRYGVKSDWISYEEIRSFRISGHSPLRFCLIGASGKSYFFAESRFTNKEFFNLFVLELRTRIRNLPDGEEQLTLIDENMALAKRIWSKPAQATNVVIAMILLVFALEYSRGALQDTFGLIRLGANAPALVFEGQYFRLITANFLHAGWFHLLLNTFALFSLGAVVERLLGPARYVCLYFLSGISGGFLSSLFSPASLSVGASSAIFGILGALLIINIRLKEDLPVTFRQSYSWWFFVLGTSAILPLVLPQIDFAAHIGGFVAGLGCTALLIKPGPLESITRREHDGILRFLAGFAVTLTALSMILGLKKAQENQATDELKVMTHFVTSEDSNFESLNQFAWSVVMNPAGDPKKLELAMTAAKRANQLEPKRHEILDTLASLYFLVGDIPAAIRYQTSAIEHFHYSFKEQEKEDAPEIFREAYRAQIENLRSVYVSQLARFQHARFKKDGIADDAWKVALYFDEKSNEKKKTMKLQLEEAPDQGLEIHVVALKGSLLIGHLAIQLPASELTSFAHNFESGAVMEWGESTRLNVVHAVKKAVSEPRWVATKYSPEVAKLAMRPRKSL